MCWFRLPFPIINLRHPRLILFLSHHHNHLLLFILLLRLLLVDLQDVHVTVVNRFLPLRMFADWLCRSVCVMCSSLWWICAVWRWCFLLCRFYEVCHVLFITYSACHQGVVSSVVRIVLLPSFHSIGAGNELKQQICIYVCWFAWCVNKSAISLFAIFATVYVGWYISLWCRWNATLVLSW